MFTTGNGIVRLCWCDEIARNQACALMYELIEGMLAICAWLAPNYWTRIIANFLARFADKFAIALHIALLEICGKSMHILIVWQQSVRLGIIKIGIPNAKQSQNNGCLRNVKIALC